MNITLCLETSSAHCSVALAIGDELFSDHRLLHRSHNEYLLAMLDSLCDEAEIQVADIELIGFGCGPGSFTGVRIASSVSQAIALAANCRIVPMPSSQVLVEGARAQLSLNAWVSAIRSRGNRYYLALYEQESGMGYSQCKQAEVLCEAPPEWLQPFLDAKHTKTVGLVGEVPPWLQVDSFVYSDLSPCARVMIAPTRAIHANRGSVDAQNALPVYVEGDSPWRKLSS